MDLFGRLRKHLRSEFPSQGGPFQESIPFYDINVVPSTESSVAAQGFEALYYTLLKNDVHVIFRLEARAGIEVKVDKNGAIMLDPFTIGILLRTKE